MDEQIEIQSQFRKQQEKYTYYIIALCVTAIGFSIHITLGQPLKYSQIPLGLSVLSWSLSAYFGIRFIGYGINILFANNAYFDVIQGRHPKAGTHPQKIEAASAGLMEAMEINSKKASRIGLWQNRLFFIGMVLFIIWHVLEMYLRINK